MSSGACAGLRCMGTLHSSDGTPIAYETAGDGPPVILVDGALCYRASGPSAPLAALLAEHFTVFTYDRRGRGESGDTAPYAVEREVEDIAALIDEAGGSACVYGISSGAALALEAANRGLGIERLVVYEAPFIVDDSRAPLPYDFAALSGLQAGDPLPAGRWAGVTMPTLSVVGGKSPAWLHHGMRALADVLPNAQLRVLEGQTHMVKAKVLAPLLIEFFGAGGSASGDLVAAGAQDASASLRRPRS